MGSPHRKAPSVLRRSPEPISDRMRCPSFRGDDNSRLVLPLSPCCHAKDGREKNESRTLSSVKFSGLPLTLLRPTNYSLDLAQTVDFLFFNLASAFLSEKNQLILPSCRPPAPQAACPCEHLRMAIRKSGRSSATGSALALQKSCLSGGCPDGACFSKSDRFVSKNRA